MYSRICILTSSTLCPVRQKCLATAEGFFVKYTAWGGGNSGWIFRIFSVIEMFIEPSFQSSRSFTHILFVANLAGDKINQIVITATATL